MPTPEEEYLALMNPDSHEPEQSAEDAVRQIAGGLLSNPNIQSDSPTPAKSSALAEMVETADLAPMETDDIFRMLDSLFAEGAVDAVKRLTIELIDRAALAETPEQQAQAIAELEQVCGEVTPEQALAMMREVIQACDEVLTEAAQPNGHDHSQPTSFAQVLQQVDPRDSDAALAMLDWLETYGRLNQVGTLHGGQGYLYIYKEPKGATKAGYVPGGTHGGRLVDQAVDKARATGAPKKRGLCSNCFSAVVEDEGHVLLDDPQAENPEVCSGSADGHSMV